MLKAWVFRYFFTQKLKIHSMLEITFKTFYFYKNLKGAHCLESPPVEQLKGRIQMHWRHSFPRWLLSINFIYFGNKLFDGAMKFYTIFYLNLFGKMGRVHLEVIYMQHTSSDPLFGNHNRKTIDCDANSVAFKDL